MKKIFMACLSAAFLFFTSEMCISEENVKMVVDDELSEKIEKEPHLLFKKSVVVKDYKQGQVYSEQHKVKRGEHLWKILRDRYQVSDSKISFFCKVAQFINPDIKDVNKVYPDQDILIPYKYLKGKGPEKADMVPSGDDAVYVVKPDDYYAKILRNNYELTGPVIFSTKTLRLFKKANPVIRDINKLEKGQKLVIPSEIISMKSKFIPIGNLAIKKDRGGEISEKPDKLGMIDEPVLPTAQTKITDNYIFDNETATKDMLSLLARSFDGTDNRSGEEEFELEGGGALKLDYSKYPLYEFPWGKKVLLDYGDSIPGGVKDVIATKWENAEIVGVQEKDDIKSILERVLDVCGFYKVEQEGEYTVNRDNIQVSVSGDWIVFKDDSLKNVFVINLINDSKEVVSPSLKSYLAGMGLSLVDVKSGGIEITKDNIDLKKADYRKISAEPLFMTDQILDLLGIKVTKDQSTNIFQNSDSGFSLEVIADRMFEKDGTVHMIDFQSLPLRIYDVIVEQGFKILNVSPEDDILKSAEKILIFCGAEYKSSPVEFQYGKSEKSKLKLKVSGVLINTGKGEVLLTQAPLNESIIQFLADMDIKIIQF